MPGWSVRLSCVFLLLACGSLAQAASINGVRMWPAPDNTRLVFDLSAPIVHNLFVLKNPERIVIDFRDTTLKSSFPNMTKASFIKDIRYGRRGNNGLRVVLDMKRNVKPRSFLLSPHGEYGNRLVVDLLNSSHTGQQRPYRVDRVDAAHARKVLVVIDPGHGGEDPGAIGEYGTMEKTVVLAIAHKVAGLINQQPGMHAVMTRQGDYYIPLERRVEIAHRDKADLFISIHADSFRDRNATGSSVYVLSEHGASSEVARVLAQSENSADLIGGVSLDNKSSLLKRVLVDMVKNSTMDDSHDLARDLLNGLGRVMPLHQNRVESANFVVLKSPDIPSVLVETAFISNPSQARKLRNPFTQNKLAHAILKGVVRYFRNNPPSGTLLALQDRKHLIIKGETLTSLADQYQVPVSYLRKLNQIHGNTLQAGDYVLIPRSPSDS